MRTPVVCLFGPTDPDKRLPYNDISVGIQGKVECKNCYDRLTPPRFYCECRRDRKYCMEAITPDMVIKAMKDLLKKTHAI